MLDEETEVALKSSCQRTGLSKADTERAITWATSVMTDHGLLENIKLGHMELCGFQDGEPLFKLSPRGEEYVRTELLPRASNNGKAEP